MIKLENISKKYSEKEYAVKNISFEVKKGSICVLVGTSGCGKSTTLKMINRLIEPNQGKILIDNTDISSIKANLLRRRIGYVIQGIGLFPHHNIFENIATVPHLLKWNKRKIKDRVMELLELLKMDSNIFSKKYPHQLSGGQQQRVGVARALAANPDILLMDEPFGAIDPINRTILQDELLKIQKKLGITVILVTHDIDEALKLSDTMIVMDKGKILQTGNSYEILNTKSEFVQQLLGSENNHSFRLMSCIYLKDIFDKAEISNSNQQNGWILNSEKLPVAYREDGECETVEKNNFVYFENSLKDATSKLISNKKKVLPVIENNQLVGQFSFLTLMKMDTGF